MYFFCIENYLGYITFICNFALEIKKQGDLKDL